VKDVKAVSLKMNLTIFIPTYNRNSALKKCVDALIKSLNIDCNVVIIDNCSCIPVRDTLKPLLQANNNKIRVVRNSKNIGGVANMLRCMELCTTRWMYCLGDDDIVEPDFAQTIVKNIQEFDDALMINFRRRCFSKGRRGTIKVNGIQEFISNLDDWSSLLFMSTSVINVEIMSSHIRWGYLYSYSWAPFQAILIKLLNTGGNVVYSKDVICLEESIGESIWIPFPVLAGKMILPELVDDDKMQKELALSLMRQPSSLVSIYWARALSRNSDELNRNKMYIKTYISRCSRYCNSVGLFALKVIAFILLNEKLVTNGVFSFIEKVVFKCMRREIPKRLNIDGDRV
jgi:glycosyltransferase involved in cell wall biosynthesis